MKVSKEAYDFAQLLIKHYGKAVKKFEEHKHDEHCNHSHDKHVEPEPVKETPAPEPDLKPEIKDKYSIDYSKW